MTVALRLLEPQAFPQLHSFWRQRWGDDFIVVHGTTYRPEDVCGFVAEEQGEWVGLITYVLRQSECEIVSLDSLRQGLGLGGSLIEKVVEQARQAGCRRVFLVTTNDNLEALSFYQKRGFELVAIHRGAILEDRRVKPAIPLMGLHGIPLRDEIELEKRL